MASGPSGLTPHRTGDPLQRMHVTRPKSAKGRTRPRAQSFSHPCPTSPTPPPPSARAPSQSRISAEDVPEFLQHLPSRPPSSTLNRYRVLPSIGAAGHRGEPTEDELTRLTSSMNLTPGPADPSHAKTLYRSQTLAHPNASRPFNTAHSTVPSDPQEAKLLLLAIRSHCGHRFQCHFHPADTLHTVLAAAEHKTGVPYRDCILESMEVPRRSFPDLSRTLQECAIPNRSVLCIHRLQHD